MNLFCFPSTVCGNANDNVCRVSTFLDKIVLRDKDLINMYVYKAILTVLLIDSLINDFLSTSAFV